MEILLAFLIGAALGALALHLARARERVADPIVRDGLLEMRASVDRLLADHGRSTGELRGRLEEMRRAQSETTRETIQLSRALGRPGVRGRWGEITLRNVIEAAGLVDRVDFDTQVHMRGEGEDASARPDLVIRLPGEGRVPVDAKLPLDAFAEAIAADDEATRSAALARHAEAVRLKVRELAAKAYWARFDRSPEMVVMFIASEAAFAAAAEHDPGLIDDAARSRVVIATPTTMLALLQVVALAWRENALSESAEQVRGLTTELVRRIAKLSEFLTKTGRALDQASRAHNDAIRSYESRLLVTARQLGDAGIAGAAELEEPAQADVVALRA